MVAAAALAQGGSLAREVVARILSLPEFALAFLGVTAPKKLRIRIVILRDEAGRPVAAADDVEQSLADARTIFGTTGVDVVPADGALVATASEPAPSRALDAPCSDSGLWRADLGPPGRYLRPLAVGGLGFLGRGAPITVFVVRDVVGKCGCSLGPFGDYVTIDLRGLDVPRILAHELAHSCGLAHRAGEGNLMRPRGPGSEISRWQRAVLRSSRHVTYL